MHGHEELFAIALAAPAAGPLLLSGVADECGFVHQRSLDVYPRASFRAGDDKRRAGRVSIPKCPQVTFKLFYRMALSDEFCSVAVCR